MLCSMVFFSGFLEGLSDLKRLFVAQSSLLSTGATEHFFAFPFALPVFQSLDKQVDCSNWHGPTGFELEENVKALLKL